MKDKSKDPYGFVIPKACRYCASEPVVSALVQKVPEKPEAVYLCQHHIENPPEGYKVLVTMNVGRR